MAILLKAFRGLELSFHLQKAIELIAGTDYTADTDESIVILILMAREIIKHED